ncbi:hypothetical protein OXYTRIMIC_754 [Oxytricha trifallax]|uniref:Uncharacterized protein n=1 Tax=Oxytricha trifallax TaxID=1172189 RepID=A0A073HZZ3_9SPIT|nr:hypothetical protein OXYTRIMIC_754 [Oxytricha trifallax]
MSYFIGWVCGWSGVGQGVSVDQKVDQGGISSLVGTANNRQSFSILLDVQVCLQQNQNQQQFLKSQVKQIRLIRKVKRILMKCIVKSHKIFTSLLRLNQFLKISLLKTLFKRL